MICILYDMVFNTALYDLCWYLKECTFVSAHVYVTVLITSQYLDFLNMGVLIC